MKRTLNYHIAEGSSPIAISRYLKSLGYSTRNLITIKSIPDTVLVNGSSVYLNYKLQPGDCLTIHIPEISSPDNYPAVELPLQIVYEDEDLLVVDKPAGMPTHPSMQNYDNTLANALAWYYAGQNIPFVFRCLNRLDRDTSGLVLIAKHMVSAGMLSAMLSQKNTSLGITREYLGITRGEISPREGTIHAPLARREGSILERVVDEIHGERAVTHYKLLSYENEHSLVSLQLETGRTHQIRVHMKHIGYPLIGDYLYNPDTEHISRQALHSHRLCFPHPFTGKTMEFISPMPSDMENVLHQRSVFRIT